MPALSETTPRDPDRSDAKPSLVKRAARWIYELARQKDPPPRIALGMALGIFIGLLPIMGIQMAVVSVFAIPLRANLKAAIAGVWISNPVTVVPLYYVNYRFGLLFTPGRGLDKEEFGRIIADAGWDWSAIGESIGRLLSMGADVLVPLWVGSTILAVIFGIPTYFVTYRLVINYRKMRGRG